MLNNFCFHVYAQKSLFIADGSQLKNTFVITQGTKNSIRRYVPDPVGIQIVVLRSERSCRCSYPCCSFPPCPCCNPPPRCCTSPSCVGSLQCLVADRADDYFVTQFEPTPIPDNKRSHISQRQVTRTNLPHIPYRLEHSPRRLLILGGPKLGFYLEQATIRV